MTEQLKPIKNILILGNGSWGSTICGMLQDPERYPEEKGFTYPGYNIKIHGPRMTIGNRPLLDQDSAAIWPEAAFIDAQSADLTIFAVPSAHMRATAHTFAAYFPHDCYILNVAKGIVYDEKKHSVDLMHEIFIQELKSYNRPWIASLAGPNIAREIREKPFLATSTAIATLFPNKQYHELLKDTFTLHRFTTLQDNPDILGLELSSALKNVIAFASGVVHGYYEEQASKEGKLEVKIMNTIGSLIEISAQEAEYMYHRIAKDKGYEGRIPYIALGDLITTALSKDSRNFKAGRLRGIAQAKGDDRPIEEILDYVGEAVESVTTTNSLANYFRGKGWEKDFIVFRNIRRVMYGQIHIEEALDSLAEGHPKIARLLDAMEKRARRNHERDKRKTEIKKKGLEQD
ncbi:MAG: hypothetical protein KAT43_02505 [Nanoarchaeota archaeon]|nr:hypothetical protein [Nanoarchaeota archaeon]